MWSQALLCFTSDFYPQAVNTQGKEAFAKELPMENKGMRFQKLFFQWEFPYAFIPFLMVPTARERKIATHQLCTNNWKKARSTDRKGSPSPDVEDHWYKNQGKGMLEVPWLAVELREWFASSRSTFHCVRHEFPRKRTSKNSATEL